MSHLSRSSHGLPFKRVTDWGPEHSVGIEPLDHDHNLIFIALGTLENELRFIRRGATLAKTAKFLKHLTERHFTREEHLMESIGFPDAKRHCEQHGLLTAWMDAVLPSLSEVRRPTYDDAVVAYLADWWSLHNERHDKPYGEFVRVNYGDATHVLSELPIVS